MAKNPTPHPYADKLTFDRIMLLIATLVNHPGIGYSDTETSDGKYRDALLEVRSQLQKIAAASGIEFPENYPATPTIRKDLETLRNYGILDKRMYRSGYYLGTGAMTREELQVAFQALASQAKHQGNAQVRRIYEKLTKLLRGLDIELKGELFYPVRQHLNRAIIYTDPVEMIDRQNNQHTLFHKLELVETAIVRGQAIELYRQSNYYGKSHTGFRRIWPLQLIYHDIAWYLICQDCDSGHLTVERVNRFSDHCEIIDREGRGLAAQEQNLKIAQKLLKNGWGLYLGKPEQQQAELEGTLKLQKVKVRFFEKVVGFILEGDRRHPRQKIKEGPRDSSGNLLYVDYWIDLPDRSLNEFSLWVNKHMDSAQVLSPPSLVEKHRQAARDLAARYR
ncbi:MULTISPECIES: WYL domain-containing protein [unclassified Microcoleus]|uniref:helix-turn-helix transcriptional regulator n=1 Tax=unclassified Microcoleus TaxID=2642155 RepID=UPI002FD2D7C2